MNIPPSCKITITPVGPWFLMDPVEINMAQRLKPERFDRFDYGKDFAGCSPRGICLSVKRSPGPARIGDYPILQKAPAGWVTLSLKVPGLLLQTNRPRLAFTGIREKAWGECLETLAIARDDLAENVVISKLPAREVELAVVRIGKLSPEVVRLLARYAKQLRLIYYEGQPHAGIPNSFSLSRDEWRLLSQYVFTGKTFGCAQETVPLTADSSGGPCRRRFAYRHCQQLKLPGGSLDEVITRWGIAAQRPSAYDGSNLLFQSVRVEDASKLSRLYPAAKFLVGRTVRLFEDSDSLATDYGREDSDQLSGFNLAQAIEAGVVPAKGELVVDETLERVFLTPSQIRIGTLKGPLEFRPESYCELAGLLCPQPLVERHLMNAAKAARTYRLAPKLKKYTVRTLDRATKEMVDLPGTYYLLSDLAALPRRDLRIERAERKARTERLIASYGSDLPEDYEQHTDDELKAYFNLKDLVARGEIVSVRNHAALPLCGDYFLEWIAKVKPELLVTCPVTEKRYLQAQVVLEDLADLPGFWKTIVGALGAPASWLRTLVLSPKVRAAALAEAL